MLTITALNVVLGDVLETEMIRPLHISKTEPRLSSSFQILIDQFCSNVPEQSCHIRQPGI